MDRTIAASSALALLIVLSPACSKKEATTTAPAAASPQASQAALPMRKAVDLAFDDVAVTTGGAALLRLGFSIHNISKDPVQCDPSEFSIALSDGTVITADQSAENKCDPDSLDPGVTGKAVVYFDLKPGYTGPITMSMTANDAIVGKGDTTVK
ncbi:MAG TPA: DUF4352 domain-containing protein [Candidatus Eremiobacteraceae bacterium]|nr:DUF4352 domain-containing protein [Candidatus Eremiobacteraceae bacterium]